MKIIAFVGATMFELQAGRLWLTIVRPKFMLWRNIKRWVRVGIDKTGGRK